MDGSGTWVLSCILLALQWKGYRAPCDVSLHPVVHTWPLGEGIVNYDTTKQSWAGNHHNIDYETGPSELGSYAAAAFNASAGSYIELPVQDFNRSLSGLDYAISFYLYVESGGDGVFLHYRSDDYGTGSGLIESFKFEIVAGSINATLFTHLGEAQATVNTNITYNTWTQIVYQRDYSTYKVRFDRPDGRVEIDAFGDMIAGIETEFPGTLRFGGSMDGESSFTGRVACVQVIPCKVPPIGGTYTAQCTDTYWPFTTTETSTTVTATPTTPPPTTPPPTTTTPTTTTPTTATPTTTTPTTATPTTTTTTPSTTTPTTTPPTATTPTTNTLSTTTTTPVTTTPTTTIVTPTTTTTTPPATTPLTTTTTPTTTTSPTTIIPATTTVPLSQAIPAMSFGNCRRYEQLNQDVGFSTGEALDAVILVGSPRACSMKCSEHGACMSFVFKPDGSCWLGPSSPVTMLNIGAHLYEVV